MAKKQKRNPTWDEEVIVFVAKILGSTVLLFVVAAGIDIYHLIH